MSATDGAQALRRVDFGIAAPLKEELASLLARVTPLGRPEESTGRVLFGRLGRNSVALCTTGDGVEAARMGAEELLSSCDPGALLVVGVGGALTADLETADVVVSRRVLAGRKELPSPDAVLVAKAVQASAVRAGTIVTWPRIVGERSAKVELLGDVERVERNLVRGPVVVDLESAHIARAAVSRGIPYLVIRAISDTAVESLPLDFNNFLNAAGGIDRSKLVSYTMRHPMIVPKLLGLKRRVETCSAALADVVAGLVASGGEPIPLTRKNV